MDRVDPAPARRLECPPPAPRPACPEPVPCEAGRRLPETPAEVDGPSGPDPVDLAPAETPRLPGLPASALKLAHEAVSAEIEGCVERLVDPAPGVALLQLAVLATEGTGRIEEATVPRATGGARSSVECLLEAAQRAEFAWSGADGQLDFRLPVAVGRR